MKGSAVPAATQMNDGNSRKKKELKKEEYKKRKERFAGKSGQPLWTVTGFIYQARSQARTRGNSQEHMKDDG